MGANQTRPIASGRFSPLGPLGAVDLGYDLVEARDSGADVTSSIWRHFPRQLASLILVLMGQTAGLVGIKQFLQPGALRARFRLVHTVSMLTLSI